MFFISANDPSGHLDIIIFIIAEGQLFLFHDMSFTNKIRSYRFMADIIPRIQIILEISN